MNRWLILCCILLILLNLSQFCSTLPILGTEIALKTIFNIGVSMGKAIIGAQSFIKEKPLLTPGESQLTKQLETLSADVQEMKFTILDKISNTLRDKLTQKIDDLFNLIKDVQRLYIPFFNMYQNLGDYTRGELQDFAHVGTTYSLKELRSTLDKLHESLVGFDFRKESIITIIAEKSEAYDTMCINSQSSQQLISNLYELVLTTHTKGITIMLFCYYVKDLLESADYSKRRDAEIKQFVNAVTDTSEKVRQALKLASREIWNCDPKKHEEGKTHLKLQPIFQTFFMYQTDVKQSGWYAAWNSCEKMKDERLNCQSYPCKTQPSERRCSGHIRDCAYVAQWMQLCHAPPGSDRRYDWMKIKLKDDYGDIHGVQTGPCAKTQGVGSVWPFDTCMCNCESEGRNQDRYFSLLDVTSDIVDNKVITGLRLTKKNYVFYIEIQQGTLGKSGNIIDEPQWKNVYEILNTSTIVSNEVSTYYYNVLSHAYQNDDHVEKFEEWVVWHENKLVFTVNYAQTAVNLNTRILGPNNVLTGVRFRQSGKSLDLQVHGTPYDYATGRLDNEKGKWVPMSNDQSRREVKLTEPDIPSKCGKSSEFSTSDQYVRFRRTDFRKDVGQNVVPYLDIQEVVTKPPLPLSGAGIFHKGRKGCGGFLGLKLVHYDFATYWE